MYIECAYFVASFSSMPLVLTWNICQMTISSYPSPSCMAEIETLQVEKKKCIFEFFVVKLKFFPLRPPSSLFPKSSLHNWHFYHIDDSSIFVPTIIFIIAIHCVIPFSPLKESLSPFSRYCKWGSWRFLTSNWIFQLGCIQLEHLVFYMSSEILHRPEASAAISERVWNSLLSERRL